MRVRKKSKAFALVIVLCLIVIASSILIAFVTVMRLDRAATQSYSQAIRADQIARGAMQNIQDQLLAEIEARSLRFGADGTTGSTVPPFVFEPLTSADMLLQRAATTASSSPLFKVSRDAVPFSSNAVVLASSASSTNPSANGRRITAGRWNRPQFFTNGWPAAQPLPDWINVTRTGPRGVTVGEARDATLSNTNFVIGRYAYAVYDVGGLLDIGVAGYTTNGSDLSAGTIARKGSLFLADLTRIPNGAATITSRQADDLVKWRNKASLPAAQSFLTNYLSTNGGLSIFPGDNSFISRQDLIRYAQINSLTNALPYLSTFHRSVNSPSFAPRTNAPTSAYAYKDNAHSAAAANRAIANVRVKTGGWTRADGSTAVSGEPLVKNRFSLNHLALLANATGNAAEIQKYFGLSGAGGNSLWEYSHGSDSHILTLDEVATAGREPDFFELLKAGILQGSLGGNAGRISGGSTSPGPQSATQEGYDNPSSVGYDSKGFDTQIFRIGANIIDQFDADSFPTTIRSKLYDAASYPPHFNEAYGIENLPYLSRVALVGQDTTPPAFNGTESRPTILLQPVLWNPHQTGASGSTSGPQNLRLLAFGQAMVQVAGWNNGGVTTTTKDQYDLGAAPDSGSSTTYRLHFSANQDFHTRPVPLTENVVDTASSPAENIPSLADATHWPNKPAGIVLKGHWNPGPESTTSATPLANFIFSPNPYVSFALQYQDGTVWRTYAVMNRVGGGIRRDYRNAANLTNLPYVGTDSYADSYQHFDPRTDRIGVYVPKFSSADPYPLNQTIRKDLTAANNRVFYGVGPDVRVGFLYSNASVQATFSGGFAPAYLAQNTTNETFRYTDADGSARAGDGCYATAASFPAGFPTAEGFTSSGQRPIVLNRPFRSVAELGYAFRDLPFKTLDFFTSESADGGLLDLFAVAEPKVSAGRINLNVAPSPVIEAILSGALKGEYSATDILSATDIQSLAAFFRSQAEANPVSQRADLPLLLSGTGMTAALATIDDKANKTRREAAVRALAEVADMRTWNLLVDVIVQAGRYPQQASSLDTGFVVEAERRYWLHLAIDRISGQIVESWSEPVYE